MTDHLRYNPGDTISEKYEILESLGEGLISSVYLARHIPSDRTLIVRFVRPELVAIPRDQQRLKKLFEEAKAIRDPRLVRLGEIGQHGGHFYYTEEHFDSRPLRAVMEDYWQTRKVFTLTEACQIIISILNALEAAHKSGCIHRDLSPDCVHVQTRQTGPAGAAKVVRTLKISALGMGAMLNPTIFADGFVPRDEAPYLAPELKGFEQEATPAADIYSVGILFYELLTGRRPRGTYLAPTEVRDDLPPHVDDVIEIALAHNPSDRYPTVRDMINDIQRSFSLEMQAPKATVSYRTIGGVFAGLLVLIIGLGGYIGFGEKPDPYGDAVTRDNALRAEVQQANPPPTDVEIKAMIAKVDKGRMVFIPGGTYISGRLFQEEPELQSVRQDGPKPELANTNEPEAVVTKVDAFYIDRHEFPNRVGKEPATYATWTKANAACESQGKRLCTAAEWEKACKGPENYIYATGDIANAESCGDSMDEPYTLGKRQECVSGYGVLGLSGGVREWTGDAHHTKNTRKVVKGGLRGNAAKGTRCAFTNDEREGFSDEAMGFRCCLDADGSVTLSDDEAETDEAGEEAGEEAAAE